MPRRAFFRRPALLAAASALLYSASFPPLELYGLAWVALAPLLIASARSTPRGAAALGLLWGYLICLLIGWPFGPMLSRHLALPLWVGWAVFVCAAPALIGVYAAGFAAVVAWSARRGRASPLLLSATWVAIEFVRQPLSAGIPWAFSGYTQMPWGTVAQLADLAGPFGLALLIAAVNAQVAGLFAPSLRARRPVLSAGALVVSLGLLYGYGSFRLHEKPATSRSVRVALVQGGFGPGDEATRDTTDKLERYTELSKAIIARKPALLVWPEFAIDFIATRASLSSLRLREFAELMDADVLLGGPHADTNAAGDELTQHNSVYALRSGRVVERYDKELPLPVAERSVLGIRDRLALGSYEPGQRSGVVETNVGPVGIVICSEAMNPSLARRRVREGATLLVNPSNDSWFGAEPAVRQQLRIASMRAIESRRTLVRPTPTGYSAIVDPWGRITHRSELERPQTIVADVAVRSDVSPYHRSGDVLPWACLALVLIASLLPARKRAECLEGRS